jgi:RimJ/RimL family protein N-acetyltransferase
MVLELIPLDKDWAHDIEVDEAAWLRTACSNFDLVEHYLESLIDALVVLYAEAETHASWTVLLARVRKTREVVGVCSLKHTVHSGEVEIGWHVFPPYQGRGHGKAMAAQIVRRAINDRAVVSLVSHTAPSETRAAQILRELDFTQEGEVFQAKEGRLSRWTLHKDQRHDRAPRILPMSRPAALLAMFA